MKKRLIFTLLFDNGHFVLSRNFRTQRIGNLEWLNRNYDFARVASFIDELVILNTSSNAEGQREFCAVVEQLSRGCFAPISVGGGIRSIPNAADLFRSGADKIVLNKAVYDNPSLLHELASLYGRQAVVASLDVRRQNEGFVFVTDSGHSVRDASALSSLFDSSSVGELYLNSIDRDGTGQGFDFELASFFSQLNTKSLPVILAGGAGKAEHLVDALSLDMINAVATANLLNFIGDGLEKARNSIKKAGIELANW